MISTEACLDYLENDRLPNGLMEEVRKEIAAALVGFSTMRIFTPSGIPISA